MWRALTGGWLAWAIASAAPPDCGDAASCQARVDSLVERLGATRDDMRRKQRTVGALEELRTGVLTGRRIVLPSAQRQHLERGSPVIGQVTFDARHRPVSTNASRHFLPVRALATDAEVRFHSFLSLKRPAASQKAASVPSALLATIDAASKLAVWGLDGGAVLSDFDLGHGPGRTLTHMAVSPSQDRHYVVTADDDGVIRVHALKIDVKKEKRGATAAGGDSEKEHAKEPVTLSTNFTASFNLPTNPGGAARNLTSVLAIDRGSQSFVVTGDSIGGISVFFKNGTLKGRVRVTEDPGGVLGLVRAQGQTVLFFTAYSFGFFSTAQIDLQQPPCAGWNSPLFDIAVDPSSSSSKVILALSDGDILVFSTASGKSKSCDLTLKFPHVSTLPFKLHPFRGHIMALPILSPDTVQKAERVRDIFFFNMAAMGAGYGLAPSRVVALQASFQERHPTSFALTATSSAQDRGKSHIALQFEGTKGVELFELNLKPPQAPKAAGAEGAGGGGDTWSSVLDSFPKVGIFGVALVGVVMWNMRKVSSQQKRDKGGGLDDFDEELFRERLREHRERKAAEQAAGAPSGGGGSSDGDLGPKGADLGEQDD